MTVCPKNAESIEQLRSMCEWEGIDIINEVKQADANAIEWVKEQIIEQRDRTTNIEARASLLQLHNILDAHSPQTKPYTDGSSFVGSHRLQGKDKTGDSSNSKGVESFDDGLTRVADTPSDDEFRKFCERLSKDKWVYIQANPDMEIIFKEARRGYVRVEDVLKSITKVHKHWHPIDRRGWQKNENCDVDNCEFRHIESEIKALAEVKE